jgi:hypothetical protein
MTASTVDRSERLASFRDQGSPNLSGDQREKRGDICAGVVYVPCKAREAAVNWRRFDEFGF